MKTFRIALAALAVLTISLPGQANVNPNARINLCTKAIEAKKVVVQLANLAKQPTFLMLQSTYGDVYYKEAIRKHNGHRTLLDLEKLPAGKYILSVRQKGETQSQVIRVTEEGVLVSHCGG